MFYAPEEATANMKEKWIYIFLLELHAILDINISLYRRFDE
jgi:hypothetical protein